MLFYRLFIEDVWKNTIKKFSGGKIPESDVAFYVNEFKKLKNQKSLQQFKNAVDVLEIQINPKYPENDINAYNTFEDLEKIVDYLKSAYAKPPKDFSLDIQIEGAKTIYKDNEVEIYRGLTRKACIEYSTGYSWCIGHPGVGNLYYPYRFKEHEPTFYFVKDLKKIEKENLLLLRQIGASVGVDSFKDKYHFFVIQVPKNGRERDIYIVTSAKNDGDEQMSWREIVSICPALSDKQDLFEHVPLNELERKAKDKFYNKPLPSLKEFANLSYEEKQIFLAVRVNSLRDLPDEYFFLLPDSLKKEFMAMGLGLTPRMYMYIIKDKDLNKYREKVGDTILTADNQDIRISPSMVYYFLGLNLDNYVNIRHRKRFSEVLLQLINFDKYADENYWEKYIKYIKYVEDKVSFLEKVDKVKLEQIALEIDESEINDKILFIILEKCSPKVLEQERYKFRLKRIIEELGTEEIINLIDKLDNRDWIALNLDELQINDKVLFQIFVNCGKEVLEHDKYKSRINELPTNLIINLIKSSSKNRDWIALNLDESKIDNYVLFEIFINCGKEVLEHYKSRLNELESREISELISDSITNRDWIVSNLDESKINGDVLYKIFLYYGEKVIEKYKSLFKELKTKHIIGLMKKYSLNYDWILSNLDESQLNDEVLFEIFYNCKKETLEKYKSYLKKLTTLDIFILIVSSRNYDWIIFNLSKSQINKKIFFEILDKCDPRYLEEEKYKSLLNFTKQEKFKSILRSLNSQDVSKAIMKAKNSQEVCNWIALNINESKINYSILSQFLLYCGKEILEHEKYKSRFKEFIKKLKIKDMIYLIENSKNRDWIALNLDKSKINEELLEAILENCSSEVANEYREMFNLN